MSGTLRSRLSYEPRELKFGTSGRRGEVAYLTQLEVYINATSELEFLRSLPPEEGGIVRGDDFYFAYDLRPSSSAYVPEENGRGEIAQAVERAVRDAGMNPVNLGRIPTPALTYYALRRRRGSIMITGSHIPFDRNGYKVNTSVGELLKKHEEPVSRTVERVRHRIYNEPFSESLFGQSGRFKTGHHELPPEVDDAREAYIARYTSFFGGSSLAGKKLLVYQHSAVGRDILVDVLRRLGAEPIPAGRTDSFLPIDTENIDDAQLEAIQHLVDPAVAEHGPIFAVVSTDGDSDRPLILGIDAATGNARFFAGDLVGMIVAEYLGADAVVVPISCSDAIDQGALSHVLEPKTRIGSPFVIAGMEAAQAKGRRAVCGWEANGGFLTGSDIERKGRVLTALPTRDAMLPILAVLFAARERTVGLADLFAALPHRFSKSALVRNFPRVLGAAIVEHFSTGDPAAIWRELSGFFTTQRGFPPISGIDYTDGVRITFENGDVAHLRPSGNADEFRIYAVSDTQERASAIAAMGVADPVGILREMEIAVKETRCSP